MDIIAIMQWGFQALFIDLGFCSTLIAIATFTLDNLSQSLCTGGSKYAHDETDEKE